MSDRVNSEIRKPIGKLNNRYEVSNLGNVRSVERIVVDSLGREGRKETAYGFKRAYKNNFKPDFISKRRKKG